MKVDNASSRILLLTRTNWHESPRLRHQVARLLLEFGHKVVFIENPSNLSRRSRLISHGDLTLIKFGVPIHHQLKPIKSLQYLYGALINRCLKKYVEISKVDLVINFNYDFFFARKLFPNAKFYTLINDDFVAQAKPWMRSAIQSQLADTCRISDRVFAVSSMLVNKLRSFSNSVELFMPWPDEPYATPEPGNRNVTLYFGFINHRIDFSVFDKFLEAGRPLRVVGPVQGRMASRQIRRLQDNTLFEYCPARPIANVVTSDVACSIVPYDLSVRSVQAVSLGNRAFQLLRIGIPVIYSNLPGLIGNTGSAVQAAIDADDFVQRASRCSQDFVSIQDDIVDFLKPHTPESRYKQLMGLTGLGQNIL